MTAKTFVVVGASYAGLQMAASARALGFEGVIQLVGDEPFLPYHRPPLSKDFLLTSDAASEPQPLKSKSFFAQERIERITGRAKSINRKTCVLTLDTGQTLRYTYLGLATGARHRTLDCPGSTSANVLHLRNFSDAVRLRAAAQHSQRAVVVGAGYIGLECAASLRKLGLEVTVVEAQNRVLPRVARPELSSFLAEYHKRQGVDFYHQTTVTQLLAGRNQQTVVQLSNGVEITCGLVLVGIGVIPNTELASASGLAISDGILVNSYGRTGDRRIVAAGDCCSYPNPWLPDAKPVRVESVQNANDFARTAAAALFGIAGVYQAVPWFWSDQFDLKLQASGWTAGYDHAVRRDTAPNRFSLFYFRGGKFVGSDSVNHASDHITTRRLLAADASLTPKQAADPSFDLKTLLDPADRRPGMPDVTGPSRLASA